MKKILTWFNNYDRSFFGDKIECNDYFATVSIMISALSGGAVGLMSITDGDMDSVAVFMAVNAVSFIILNVAESIMTAKDTRTIILRSLLMTLAIALASAVGYFAAMVVVIIVAIWLILLAISLIFSGGSSSGRRRGTLSDGTEVEETGSGLLGEKYYTSKDGSRRFEGHSGSDSVKEI